MIHALKIEKKYFEAVASGNKTFELRKNDRYFAVGDFLALNEVTREINSTADTVYTGRCCLVEVDYILDSEVYLQPGYVCLAIKPCGIARRTDDLRYGDNFYEVPTYQNTKEPKK